MDFNLDKLCTKEYFAGFHGKMIHTEHMTMAFWEVDAGAEVAVHAHHHEQIMHVLEGDFEFTLDGKTGKYKAGDIVVIPPDVPHSGKAIGPCKILDVFSPVREDYN